MGMRAFSAVNVLPVRPNDATVLTATSRERLICGHEFSIFKTLSLVNPSTLNFGCRWLMRTSAVFMMRSGPRLNPPPISARSPRRLAISSLALRDFHVRVAVLTRSSA